MNSTEELLKLHECSDPTMHTLLSNFEFILLVLFAVLCQCAVCTVLGYVGGDCPSSLLFPFPAVKTAVEGVAERLGPLLWRRQQVWVGVDYEDDGVDYDYFQSAQWKEDDA
uniref:Uncharacterized protein n=1 Tax=Trypanosoma congolense (strain IL3000) TaxID=1068625 RepID=G0V3A9_TRYCI|nr:hypothetical protein, unlikely [Trypanosoma congolense IL3000]